MQITPINKNTSVNFNGTVDKSITKYVENNVNNYIKETLKKSNQDGVAINKENLISLKNRANTILETLNSYMSKLHPDTKLNLETGILSTRVLLENGKEKSFFKDAFYSEPSIKGGEIFIKKYKPFFHESDIKRHHYSPEIILGAMESFTKELTQFKPKDFDKLMYNKKFETAKAEMAIHYSDNSFFNFGFKMNKAINNFYKYAKDLKIEKKAKKLINEAKENAQKDAIENNKAQLNKKKITTDNNNFVKELLKK